MSGTEIGRAAFENHLRFLGDHRGTLRRDRDAIRVESPAAGFSSWTPAEEDSAIPADCEAVRLAPWSGPAWQARLERAGFSAAETLAYMSLPGRVASAAPAPVPIATAHDERGALDFAAVQSAGFATGDAAIDLWWEGYFAEMAIRNVGDRDQSFYLAQAGGGPAACALIVRAAGVAGIYAVATRPDHRNRGLGAALLAKARQDARAAGCGGLILQAMKNSYAEGYYARLGFERLYELTVWRRS